MPTLRAPVSGHTRVSDPGAAQEIYLLSLKAPAVAQAARPGQFVMLRVAQGLDPLLARPFSIHGVEGEDLLILYRVAGRGTRLLTQTRPGEELTLWGPLGRGFDLSARRPVLVAGGMGIAPMRYAALTLVRSRVEVILHHAATTKHGLFGGSELLRREITGSEILAKLATDDGSEGFYGLITGPLAGDLPGRDAVLACGPLAMLGAVARMCAEHHVPCQVSLEAPMACGVGACLGCAIPAAGGGYARACQEGPVMDAALVDWGRL